LQQEFFDLLPAGGVERCQQLAEFGTAAETVKGQQASPSAGCRPKIITLCITLTIAHLTV
jgi:hypothetical protein